MSNISAAGPPAPADPPSGSAGRPRSHAAMEAAGLVVPLPEAPGVSAEQRVYGAVRLALMSGQILPGTAVSIRTLSAHLGVSPTPVREALKRLQAEGALLSGNRRAYLVPRLSVEDYRDLTEVRFHLEGLAAARACRHVTAADLAALEELNEIYAASASGRTASVKTNFDFHFALYSLSRSAPLMALIEMVWVRVAPVLFLAVQRYPPQAARVHHDAMLAGLRAGDEAAVTEALRQDFRSVVASVTTVLAEAP